MAELPALAPTSIDSQRDEQLWLGNLTDCDQRCKPTRRGWLVLAMGLASSLAMPQVCLALPSEPGTSAPPRKGLLVRSTTLNSLNTRAKIVLEVDGELRLKEPDPHKQETVRRAEVKGKSTLDYFEKIAFKDGTLVGSARRYVVAEGENWISGSASNQQLRPACRESIMLKHQGTWEQYCDSESLDVRETELLHSPINSAALELLLPEKPAKPTSAWSISSPSARSIFNLDAVHQSSLSAKISKVEKGVATIEVSGDLDATANSVPTRLSIEGNFNAKFAGDCVAVTWLGLSIKETRDISEAEPGFTVTARIRMIREVTGNELAITADALRDLADEADEAGKWLVRLTSNAGRYSMLADRSWKTYIDSGEEAILRMIENNTIIAQCNVNRLPNMDEGSQLTLAGMQEDIRQSLGESFEQFLQSNEKVTSRGLRLLRCVVVGNAEEVPVQWIYNHLSDDKGRRMAIIFTMGGNVTDRFAAADEQMTSSLEFLLEADAPEHTPTTAPPPVRSARR